MLDNKGSKKNEGRQLARAFDDYLYEIDIVDLVPPNTKADDSMMIVKSYIDNWIKEKVLLHKAQESIGDYEKQVESQVSQYRNSLITYAYQKAIIKKQLDTLVNEAEINKYYEDNKNNFLLKENITRCIYAKFYSNTQDLKKLKQWMVSSVEADREKVDNFCLQYAFDYFLNDDTWLSFADLMLRTGIKTYNQEQFLQSTKVIEVPDSGSVTIVRFYDFKIKESLSPLSFENNNIRNLIINKRKLDLITKLENAAYDNALKKNEFEIFKK